MAETSLRSNAIYCNHAHTHTHTRALNIAQDRERSMSVLLLIIIIVLFKARSRRWLMLLLGGHLHLDWVLRGLASKGHMYHVHHFKVI